MLDPYTIAYYQKDSLKNKTLKTERDAVIAKFQAQVL
jgi:hypothetical protein